MIVDPDPDNVGLVTLPTLQKALVVLDATFMWLYVAFD